ncbi:MAG: hypothetical protein J6U55_02725, partial [Bacteroidaceae bacterium]|nr:hypothetical protein [Bacteroidaceae bacterium]
MLRIDENRLAECNLSTNKLYRHPTIANRFVYKVESTREAERAYGCGDAAKYDVTGQADQSG